MLDFCMAHYWCYVSPFSNASVIFFESADSCPKLRISRGRRSRQIHRSTKCPESVFSRMRYCWNTVLLILRATRLDFLMTKIHHWLPKLKKSDDILVTKVRIREGRAIAQAVSGWLDTEADTVRARVWSCGICGGESGSGGKFSPSTSVSPANFHSTICSTITIIYHLGLVQ
jgi:hypothetical protein